MSIISSIEDFLATDVANDPPSLLSDFYSDIYSPQLKDPTLLEFDIGSSQDVLPLFHSLEAMAPCENRDIFGDGVSEFDYCISDDLITKFDGGDAGYSDGGKELHEGLWLGDSATTSRDSIQNVDDLTVSLAPSTSLDVPELPCAAPAEPQDSAVPSGREDKGAEARQSQQRRRRPKVYYKHMPEEEKHSRIRTLNNEASKLYRKRRRDTRTQLAQEIKELTQRSEALREKVKSLQEFKERVEKCQVCGERLAREQENGSTVVS